MRKIAFFVEGQTEQIFVDRLVKEVLGYDSISIILKRTIGGTNMPKQEMLRSVIVAKNPRYQVLINDCGSDNRVKSEILDHIESLRASGYECIVGLRDLYPLPEEDLPRLERGLKFVPIEYRKYKNPYDIVVAVREVETWFLAEVNHFKKVDSRLTGSLIDKYLRFNPYSTHPVSREHPSKDINDIYRLVGKSYTKKYWQVKKLVSRLDFDYLLRHIRYEIPSLGELVSNIERFKEKS